MCNTTIASSPPDNAEVPGAPLSPLPPQHLPAVSVNNLVCTWYIGHKGLDLKDISQRAPFLTYDPHRFAAAICHMQSPKATCLLFNTGRGVCAGTKSRESAFFAVTQLISMIQRAGVFFGHVREFKVRNLVASSRCPFTVDLQRMATAISSHCTYHAGLFPGLRFKPGIDGNKRQALLIYRNGGTVITGNSSVSECKDLWAKVYDIICRFRTDMPVGMENSADYRIRMKIRDNKNGAEADAVATREMEEEREHEQEGVRQERLNGDDGNGKETGGGGDDDDNDDDGEGNVAGDEEEDVPVAKADTHANNTIQRENVTHISDTCRLITKEVLLKSSQGKRWADFTIISMHERNVRHCRQSVASNMALLAQPPAGRNNN